MQYQPWEQRTYNHNKAKVMKVLKTHLS